MAVHKSPPDSIAKLIFCSQNQSNNPNYQQFFNRTSNKFRSPPKPCGRFSKTDEFKKGYLSQDINKNISRSRISREETKCSAPLLVSQQEMSLQNIQIKQEIGKQIKESRVSKYIFHNQTNSQKYYNLQVVVNKKLGKS